MIYLDYNATAPLLPGVKAAMLEVMGAANNPSSIHAAGRAARKIVEDARREVLRSVNGESLVFCGSATEANNLALGQFQVPGSEFRVYVSAIEHDSIFKHPNAEVINVTPSGLIDLKDLNSKLGTRNSKLVSIMLANNETGVIQPVAEAAAIAHEYGALVHCDAVQAYGRININFKELDVDLMTISSHKAGGSVGAAALIHKSKIELKPILFGGGQEKNKRPGTESVSAIHGFGIFAQSIRESRQPAAHGGAPSEEQSDALGAINNFVSRETNLNKLIIRLESEIKKLGGSVVGEAAPRLPNTSCITMPNMDAATQLIHFDTNGICLSSGSACSSGKVEVSRVLKAMNIENPKNAVRVSIGWATTEAEVQKFIEEWRKLCKRAAEKAA